jgi:hypothetical protein
MQLSFPTEDSIMGNFWWQVIGELGAHDQLISEHADRFLGYDRYTAVHTFESGPTQFALIAMLNADGGVGGLNVIPLEEAPSAYLDYETVTALRLPFDGEWLVVQGGRTAGVNQHAGHVDQRFAIDFVVVRDERSFGGEGVTLEDHYCFGMPVRAPASGVVVDALDGVADNGIGQPNESAPAGNYVLIDHGNGEFSVLAHLQNGSVEVEAGQQIQQGDVLGSCGNSGNSAEPHVHFHLQNGPTLFQAEALPATFVDYVANGDSVDRGEPVQGTTVEAR